MKLVYSKLKEFLPKLDVDPQKLRDDLTMIGHFTNYFEKIDGQLVFDLDIKVNRGDCLSYYGLARDLAIYYQIPLNLPQNKQINPSNQPVDIHIKSPDVIRLQAIKIDQIQNTPSPDWLVGFLKLHQINSVNTLVDLTNYITLIWGIPSHAFDIAKTGDSLTWENNTSYSQFRTLDGTNLNLQKQQLLITNQKDVLSLSFIGGDNSGIDLHTTQSIVEMTIYSRSKVRSDSRFHKIITEASLRLEKDLDPETLPLAFNHLISLILEHTHATINSSLFDYYPNPVVIPQIEFDTKFPSKISGIDIPTDFSINCLTNLGCILSPLAREGSQGRLIVTPPSIRKDLQLAQDLVEEVVRFYGYQKIPSTQPLSFSQLTDITPKVLYLIENLKDKLSHLGYDEILSWPLVQQALDPKTAIATQNSINADYPFLRQTIIQSLKNQVDQYQRLKLPHIKIFEIGKVYTQPQPGNYQEYYALGLYHPNSDQLHKDLQSLSLKPELSQDNYFQINLSQINLPSDYIYTFPVSDNQAFELTSQIIILDANLTLPSPQKPSDLIEEYSPKIPQEIFWSMEITDIYHDSPNNQYRYTFRVCYYNTDDKTAKQAHLKAFNLN